MKAPIELFNVKTAVHEYGVYNEIMWDPIMKSQTMFEEKCEKSNLNVSSILKHLFITKLGATSLLRVHHPLSMGLLKKDIEIRTMPMILKYKFGLCINDVLKYANEIIF